MNVVTANENKEIIDRLDIDIIKRIVGQFELKELLSKFVNLYFNKMIIDITSIADYRNTETINQLAKAVDPSRVILLLNSDPTVNSQLYMSNLIKNVFYNFTRNYEGIKFLYNTPNTYENVKHLVLSEDEVRRQEFIEEQKRQRALEETQGKIKKLQNMKMVEYYSDGKSTYFVRGKSGPAFSENNTDN